MKTLKIHLATNRQIGLRCFDWLIKNGYQIASMEDCDIFISVMYDKLIPEDYIASRPCYNFHPGVLPWYRGAGAYSWAIINGEFETGITLHKIDKDIDHGSVIDIWRFPITNTDTSETLFKRAEHEILEMFKNWLPAILRGRIALMKKQEDGRIYYRKDLEKVKDLTRYVRAFTFKGKDNAYFINKKGEKIELKYE